jgi:hypothetical protein
LSSWGVHGRPLGRGPNFISLSARQHDGNIPRCQNG